VEYIEIGKIVNTQGLKGEVKMYSYTDNPEGTLKLKKIYIADKCYEIEKARVQANMFVLKLKGFDKIEDTKSIMNKEVFRELKKEEKEESKEDGFFIKDLVGMEVEDEERVSLGILREVFSTGANDVYSVEDKEGKQLLLPAIKQVILSVDTKAHKMVVHVMKGLR